MISGSRKEPTINEMNMNKIMRNSLACAVVGFIALTACANKKSTTETTPTKDKEEVKKEIVQESVTPKSISNNPIEIDKDRSACLEPWGNEEQQGENRKQFGYMQVHFQSRDYASAIESWRHLVKNAPCGHKNIYLIGEVILKDTISKETDSLKKLALVADLNTNFKQRIQYFGDEDNQRERWAKALYNAAPGEYEIINDNLERSIDRDGDSTESDIMIYYLNNSFKAYNDDKITPEVMFDKYGKLADIVEHNLEVTEGIDSAEFARWSALQTNLDIIIAKVGTCEDLLKQFKPDLETHATDKDWLNKAEKALRAKKCTKDPLYISVLEKLYAVDPSLTVAKRLAKYYYGAGKNNTKGESFWLKAINLETDPVKKSNMYLYLANRSGSASAKLNYANLALKYNSRNGNAILAKGAALYKKARACSDFDKIAAPYVMMEYALKAKAADPSVTSRANQSYNRYNAYKPDQETLFLYGRKKGDKYTIKCIGVAVTIR